MIHVVTKNDMNQFQRFKRNEIDFKLLESFFHSEIQMMINSMLEIIIDNDQKEALECSVSLYDHSKKNDKSFWDGRMEQREVLGYNTQIISVGGYFAIRMGQIEKNFKADQKLQSRCSKITELHELAAAGRAVLPGGVTQGKNETILPCAPQPYNMTPEEDKKRVEPVSIMYIL